MVPGQRLRPLGRRARPDVLRDELREARRGPRTDRPVRRTHARRGHVTRSAALERYEAVIGIEVHCQVRTASKMFCACAAPTSPTRRRTPTPARSAWPCPGVLPTINRGRRRARPDDRPRDRGDRARRDPLGPQELLLPGPAQGLPDQPVRPAAGVARVADLRHRRRARCSDRASRRAHLEEDTAKLVHATGPDGRRVSLVDFNRAGVPLMEIVTEPDIRTAEQARRYAEELRLLLRTIDVSDAEMENGADAGGGERLAPAARDGGVRHPGRGQEHELAAGRRAGDRRTRSSARPRPSTPASRCARRRAAGTTPPARRTSCGSRRSSDDYRYFPEPDLPPLHLDPAWLDELRAALPELPAARRARYVGELGLSPYDADGPGQRRGDEPRLRGDPRGGAGPAREGGREPGDRRLRPGAEGDSRPDRRRPRRAGRRRLARPRAG